MTDPYAVVPRGSVAEWPDIEVITSVEAVRMRPWIYLGDLDEPKAGTSGVVQLLALSLEAAGRGPLQTISIRLERDGVAELDDDGPGLSLDPIAGQSILERELTMIHTNGPTTKGSIREPFPFLAALANACSEWLVVRNHSDGVREMMSFERGIRVQGPGRRPTQRHGIHARMKLDPLLFLHPRYDVGELRMWLDRIRRQLPALEIDVIDRQD